MADTLRNDETEEQFATRKHFYLITGHREEEHVGRMEIADRQKVAPVTETGEVAVQMRDMDTGEQWNKLLAPLGYHDFDDEQDYEDRVVDVMHEKLADAEERHLEKAGIDLEEVLDDA